MNIKHPAVILAGILVFPAFAHAQADAPIVTQVSSSWGVDLWQFFWCLAPVLICIAVFIPLIRRMQKPIMKRTQDHMARQVQHMERVEQSLDRIIQLLEKKD
jgi:hypothetical protein